MDSCCVFVFISERLDEILTLWQQLVDQSDRKGNKKHCFFLCVVKDFQMCFNMMCLYYFE